MDKKILDWININLEGQHEIWGLLPDSVGEKKIYIQDSYSDYEKRLTKFHIETCNAILKLRPNEGQIIKWKGECEELLKAIEVKNPLPKVNLSELIERINNAFFRLESFMNGIINDYPYFGFNDAFTQLFFEVRKPENCTYSNCKLISEYWGVNSQISVDYDKTEFKNVEAYENEMFCQDCEEIMYLTWDRVGEFCQFLTPDEIAESERKFSITDILKAPATPPQQSETKTEKIKKELGKYGFFELPKIKQLTEPNKQNLVELISSKPMPYGIAMFDYLGFCEYLDNEQGTKYKADIILSKLYNEKAKDGTSAKHYRRSLIIASTRYKASEYKETVKTDYQELK